MTRTHRTAGTNIHNVILCVPTRLEIRFPGIERDFYALQLFAAHNIILYFIIVRRSVRRRAVNIILLLRTNNAVRDHPENIGFPTRGACQMLSILRFSSGVHLYLPVSVSRVEIK